MSLYRLPHGQYAYSGHVINLPQDVASFANSLPRLPSELDVIVVRKEGAANVYIGMFAQARPPPPNSLHRLVIIIRCACSCQCMHVSLIFHFSS